MSQHKRDLREGDERECFHTSFPQGELPDCFNDVKDKSARAFILKLIGQGSSRPSAADLLTDPFLTTVTDSDKQFIEVDSSIMAGLRSFPHPQEKERLEKQIKTHTGWYKPSVVERMVEDVAMEDFDFDLWCVCYKQSTG